MSEFIQNVVDGVTTIENLNANMAAQTVAMETAVEDERNARIAGDNATITNDSYAGQWDASSGSFPSVRSLGGAVKNGDWFKVSVSGTVDGVSFVVGEEIRALKDDPSTSTLSNNWDHLDGVTMLTPLNTSVARIDLTVSRALTGASFGNLAPEVRAKTGVAPQWSSKVDVLGVVPEAGVVSVTSSPPFPCPSGATTVYKASVGAVQNLSYGAGIGADMTGRTVHITGWAYSSSAAIEIRVGIGARTLVGTNPATTTGDIPVNSGWTFIDEYITVEDQGATEYFKPVIWVRGTGTANVYFSDFVFEDVTYSGSRDFLVASQENADAASATLPEGSIFTMGGSQYLLDSAAVDSPSSFDGARLWDVDKPLFVLCLGQSNMRGSTLTTGGDYSIPDGCYTYDNGQTVEGSTFELPAYGNYPFDLTDDGGTTYNQSLPMQIMRELHLQTGRQVYMLTIAKGNTKIEGWIKDATLTANGWSRGADTNMTTVMYPQISEALAQVPNGSGVVDYLFIHQGEANSSDSVSVYRDKFAKLFLDLSGEGVVNSQLTTVVAGGLAEARATYQSHKAAMSYGLTVIPNMRYVDSSGLVDRGDGTHFTGNAKTAFGKRYVGAALGTNPTRTALNNYPTWLPVVSDATTGGNLASISGTAGSQLKGRAWRIDRQVVAQIDLRFINTTGMTPTNPVIIQNLPWLCIDDFCDFSGTAQLRRVNQDGYITAYVPKGTKNMRFRVSTDDTAGRDLLVSDIQDDLGSIIAQVTYLTVE